MLGRRFIGVVEGDGQRAWIERKGERHGFSIAKPTTRDYFAFAEQQGEHAYTELRISHQQMLIGRQHNGNSIRVYSVLYEGRLVVTDADGFREAINDGIGHGKVMGLGLLSLIPISD